MRTHPLLAWVVMRDQPETWTHSMSISEGSHITPLARDDQCRVSSRSSRLSPFPDKRLIVVALQAKAMLLSA